MKSLQISFILVFSFLLISEEAYPTYGKGLPRDSDELIPSDSSYPIWETGKYESINPQRMKDIVIDISNIALESKKRTHIGEDCLVLLKTKKLWTILKIN